MGWWQHFPAAVNAPLKFQSNQFISSNIFTESLVFGDLPTFLGVVENKSHVVPALRWLTGSRRGQLSHQGGQSWEGRN